MLFDTTREGKQDGESLAVQPRRLRSNLLGEPLRGSPEVSEMTESAILTWRARTLPSVVMRVAVRTGSFKRRSRAGELWEE